MGGYEARRGFRYQDLYLLLRVLRTAGDFFEDWKPERFDNALSQFDTVDFEFGLEASRRVEAEGFPVIDWDVIVSRPEKLELAEIKSGAISKSDRAAFWKRIRREMDVGNVARLHPVLVVDPDYVDPIEKWTSFSASVSDVTADDIAIVFSQCHLGRLL